MNINSQDPLTGYQDILPSKQEGQTPDKLEILGFIRSSELKKARQSHLGNLISSSSRQTPEIKKTHVMLVDGITCFSLGLH